MSEEEKKYWDAYYNDNMAEEDMDDEQRAHQVWQYNKFNSIPVNSYRKLEHGRKQKENILPKLAYFIALYCHKFLECDTGLKLTGSLDDLAGKNTFTFPRLGGI
ncbi:MAG: hypothetical protein ACJ0QT_01925 [Gammaproteobacteria bacterium]